MFQLPFHQAWHQAAFQDSHLAHLGCLLGSRACEARMADLICSKDWQTASLQTLHHHCHCQRAHRRAAWHRNAHVGSINKAHAAVQAPHQMLGLDAWHERLGNTARRYLIQHASTTRVSQLPSFVCKKFTNNKTLLSCCSTLTYCRVASVDQFEIHY